MGHIETAQARFQELNAMALKRVEARLAGTWLSTNQDYQKRTQTFLQVTAGLADVSAAEALHRSPENL